MLWWVVSAAIASAGAIVQTVFGDVIPGGTVHFGRVSGLTDHVNDLGGLTGVTAVPALALLYKRTGASGVQRATAMISLPLIGAGLMLSGSISGAMAAVFSGFIFVVATRTFVRGAIAFLLLLAVSAAIAASGISPYFESPFDRVTESTTDSGTDNATFWSRIDSYEAAWVEIRAHPLYGVGLSPGDTPTATGAQVHNNLMKPLFEGGALAALGMTLVYLLVGMAGWQTVVRARSPEEHLLALAALSSYIAYFTWGLSQPALFKRFGWMSGALVLAIWAQQLRATRVLERSAHAPPAGAGLPALRPPRLS
jgi:O-antigen ligase